MLQYLTCIPNVKHIYMFIKKKNYSILVIKVRVLIKKTLLIQTQDQEKRTDVELYNEGNLV